MTTVRYDSQRRRLWIAGQRCHHGATGALMTGAAAAALVVWREHVAAWSALVAGGAAGREDCGSQELGCPCLTL